MWGIWRGIVLSVLELLKLVKTLTYITWSAVVDNSPTLKNLNNSNLPFFLYNNKI